MTSHLLVRTAIAVPVAALLPLGLSRMQQSAAARAILAAMIVVLALAGSWGDWQTWAAVACASAAAAAVGRSNRPRRWFSATLAAAAVSVCLVDAAGVRDGLEAVANDWRVSVVVLGGLACVFVGGAIIKVVLRPFAERVGDRSDVAGMENAGRIIGWIERSLLYGLVLLGVPDAAALVIAGKSIARFPSFKEEQFAEYYLIGSLLSLTIALGAAVAVRAIVGLDPVALF